MTQYLGLIRAEETTLSRPEPEGPEEGVHGKSSVPSPSVGLMVIGG